MAFRISTKPADLTAQLWQAAFSIGNEATWPVAPSVPTAGRIELIKSSVPEIKKVR